MVKLLPTLTLTPNQVVKLLLELGAAPDTRNKQGATPLSHAAFRGQLGALQLLLAHGADLLLASPLHAALGRGAALRGKRLTKAVDQLLAAGAPPDSVALAMAAEAGEAGAAASLLKAGVAVDEAVGSSSTSPLIKAAAAGRAGIVRLLVRHGADVNATAGEGMHTAPYRAALLIALHPLYRANTPFTMLTPLTVLLPP